MNVSMGKGSEAVNRLQIDKKPRENYSYQTLCVDYKARTLRNNGPHTCTVPWSHNNTRLKQPVGRKDSDRSLKIGIMISHVFKRLFLYLHSFDSLLAIELTIDNIQSF